MIVVLATLTLVLALPLCTVQKWVGSSDVEIRFVVTDAETGEPIPDAAVSIHVDGRGLCEECGQGLMQLETDSSGEVAYLAKRCVTFGSLGTFDDTFCMHLPPWQFRVLAKGYKPSPGRSLEESEYFHAVKRGKPFATLSVPVQLRPFTETSDTSNLTQSLKDAKKER